MTSSKCLTAVGQITVKAKEMLKKLQLESSQSNVAPCKRIHEGPGFWIPDPSLLDSGSRHLDSGLQPFGFRIPTFWIPDSIQKRWIPDSKPLWISGFRIPKAKICWIPDSGFSYMGRLTGHNTEVELTKNVYWSVY